MPSENRLPGSCRLAALTMPVVVGLTGFSALAQTTLTNLGLLPGAQWARVNGISSDGSTVVGQSFIPGTGRRAFRWTSAGGMQNLGVLSGGTESSALAANGDGSVVVGSGTISTGFNRPTRWTSAGGLVNLGVPATITGGEAYGISSNGSVVACGLTNSSIIAAGRCCRPVWCRRR
jgi:probable HAF family extracellular repeat protein